MLIIAVFSVKAAWGMYEKFVVASRGAEAAEVELAQLSEQYTRVSTAVDNLSTTRGEEGEIRERFGVALPGEGAIQIIRASSSTNDGNDGGEGNIFSRIFRALFVW